MPYFNLNFIIDLTTMHKRLLFLSSAALLVGILAVMPKPSRAFSAELVSVSPEVFMDISDQVGPGPEEEGAPTMEVFGWVTQTDVEYTAVFTVDEEPAMLVTPGGDVSLTTRPSYNADTGEYTVVFTATGLVPSDAEKMEGLPEGYGASIVGMIGAVAIGENGPPAEMRGGWLSTDLQQWELIPPSEETVAFGFNLTGDEGETGYFHMFIPDAIIDLLGQFSGKDLTAQDLAVFNGDEQASLSVTEMDGGAYVDINVTFEAEITTLGISAVAANSITKSITAAPKLPVSLAASKTVIAKGSTTRLYGWLKNGKKGETVTVWYKAKGQDSFKKLSKLTTGEDGYFKSKVQPNKTTTYKIKYKTKTSPKTKVTVNS